MTSLHMTRPVLSKSVWRRVCSPFLPRWFPSFFCSIVFAVLTSGVAAQQPSPPASNNPATLPAVVATPPSSPSAAQAPNATDAPTEDIRDIRGPISIPSPWRWLWFVAGATAVLGLLYGAWRWYRLFMTAKAKQPYEIALARLEEAKALMKPEQAREYSFAVSEITRDYIEKRFHERAAWRTTEEFLHDLLRRSGIALAAHQPLLEDFLHHCDLAKFGRWELDVPQMESMHESARTFILSTRPEPKQEKSATQSKNGSVSPAIAMRAAVHSGRQV